MRTSTLGAAEPDSTDILAIANSPILWIFVVGVFTVILIQTVIYMRAAKTVAPSVGMTPEEVRTSFRAGAIAAIGPSLAVALVAVSLLTVFGTPGVLVRVGLIGSVSYETAGAAIAAHTADAELGGPNYTQGVFGLVLAAISFGGALFMIAALVLTPILRRGDSALRKASPRMMLVIPGAALVAAFAALGVGEMPKSWMHVTALGSSAATMTILIIIAERWGKSWIKEWGLGVSILVGLTITHVVASL